MLPVRYLYDVRDSQYVEKAHRFCVCFCEFNIHYFSSSITRLTGFPPVRFEQFQQAGNEFHKGNPEPMLKMWTQSEDASLAGPFGPVILGWDRIAENERRVSSIIRDGEPIDYEIVAKVVTPDLAFIVENERSRAKFGGSQDFVTPALRATIIFRKEDGVWKIVRRHADPILSPQPLESVIQRK